MPRRREFRGAALGLLGAFMSRNNDVGGYWALGKLYKHAKAANAAEVRIDVLGSTIEPPSAEFANMLDYFRKQLARQLASRALSREWLIYAEIAVRFTGQASAVEPGDVFECRVTLVDDLGRQHQARERGACWVHTPLIELKSTRVY
jgi:hypothetical protein